jgi:hypothetical protein
MSTHVSSTVISVYAVWDAESVTVTRHNEVLGVPANTVSVVHEGFCAVLLEMLGVLPLLVLWCVHA